MAGQTKLVKQLLLGSVDKVIKIKPSTRKALAKAGLDKVIQVLFHMPLAFRDRGFEVDLSQERCTATVRFFVKSKSYFRNLYSVKGVMLPLFDALFEEKLTLKFFQRPYFWGNLEGEFYVSGTIIREGKGWVMSHPDYVEKSLDKIPKCEPVYSTNLRNVTFIRIVERLFSSLEWEMDDWQDCEISFMDALKKLHQPDAGQEARLRLLRDEILACRYTWEELQPSEKGVVVTFKELPCSLPFALSPSQKQALGEIEKDISSGEFMFRLLQGDVGSGKTIVAFLPMIQTAMNGYQACLMAPTQVLARQHYEKLCQLLEGTGLNCQYVTSGSKMDDSVFGETTLFVGTHALFQERVNFSKLGLAIIDEQHRFGAFQRFDLFKKGYQCHVLMMSATPIPRTLFLSRYCGLKSSRLQALAEKRPVTTSTVSCTRIKEVWERLKKPLQEGTQVYWVCPLVAGDGASAEERFREMSDYFVGWELGILHGSMDGEEKERVLGDFLNRKLHLLVTTSIVEVGVDVPSANIVVIEHAEQFGLVQLHQLRGRVGRGQDKGICILLYGAPLSDGGKERLKLIKNLQDGFALAEEDLKMRGKGEISGKAQSGYGVFRFGSLDEAEAQEVDYDIPENAKSLLCDLFASCS